MKNNFIKRVEPGVDSDDFCMGICGDRCQDRQIIKDRINDGIIILNSKEYYHTDYLWAYSRLKSFEEMLISCSDSNPLIYLFLAHNVIDVDFTKKQIGCDVFFDPDSLCITVYLYDDFNCDIRDILAYCDKKGIAELWKLAGGSSVSIDYGIAKGG